jgi:hypothetical protein
MGIEVDGGWPSPGSGKIQQAKSVLCVTAGGLLEIGPIRYQMDKGIDIV